MRCLAACVRADLLLDTSGLSVTPSSGWSFSGVVLYVKENAASTFLTGWWSSYQLFEGVTIQLYYSQSDPQQPEPITHLNHFTSVKSDNPTFYTSSCVSHIVPVPRCWRSSTDVVSPPMESRLGTQSAGIQFFGAAASASDCPARIRVWVRLLAFYFSMVHDSAVTFQQKLSVSEGGRFRIHVCHA